MTKINLRSYQHARDTATLETNLPGASFNEVKRGFFCDLADRRIAIFLHSGAIYLAIDQSVYDSRKVTMSHEILAGNRRSITLTEADREVTIEYCVTPVATDYFPYESEEDADFGLWLCSILNSDQRKNRVTERWARGI